MEKSRVIFLIKKVKRQQKKDMLGSDLLKGKLWNNEQVISGCDKYLNYLVYLIEKEK